MVNKLQSHRLSRRDFVKTVMAILGTIMGVVIGLPIIGYLVSPAVKVQKLDDWISLGPLDNYPIGVPIFFNFTRTRVNGWEKTVNSYGVYVYRKDENQLKVFSDICTHLACRFKWHMDIKEFVCPCHDGHFDIEGYVTKGPPPRPLDQYEYKIEDGVVQIYLMKG